jgi:hypothetical protein
MLLVEEMRRSFTLKEAKSEAAKREQYAVNFRKKVTENPSSFKKNQWIRLKTGTLSLIPNGSEGVILEVLFPVH